MTINTRTVVFGSRLAAAGLVLALGVSGCTRGQMVGTSSSYLIIDSLEAASGAVPAVFSGTLGSDVLTYVNKTIDGKQVRVPTIFEDIGKVTFRMALKDPGGASTPLSPTSANYITVTRYHVQFIRSDGRNTPGVDVPYAFDGAATGSATVQPIQMNFILVRAQAKQEAPLLPLVDGGGQIVISTIAEITFYGADQTGRPVSVVGRISVNFADWGDPG